MRGSMNFYLQVSPYTDFSRRSSCLGNEDILALEEEHTSVAESDAASRGGAQASIDTVKVRLPP